MNDQTLRHSGDPESDPILERYLLEAMERAETGQTVAVEELCRAHPHLAEPLREALAISASIPGLQREARTRDPMEGVCLGGRYRLLVRLGAGAMGAVYRARDEALRREVAVKVLQAGLFARGSIEERFSREAELLAALDHPRVVAVYDSGTSDRGVPFLVMRLLEGASLAAVLAEAESRGPAAFASLDWLRPLLGNGAPPEATFLRLVAHWGREMANALGAAHARGIFHRDVKPSNVFVTRDAQPVLLDFGIAACVDADGALTASGTTLGTPWYMPPEQAAGNVRPGPAQDVYSLCATLYHLSSGKPPFEDEPARVLLRLQSEDPTPLRRLRPELPRDLVAIVERGMERDPVRRYRDMAALEADLAAFLEHRPVSVRPVSPVRRLWRRVRRAPVAVLGAVVVLLAAALVTGGALWRQSEQQDEKARLMALLPAQLSIEGRPEERLIMPLGRHREALQLLDRILAIDPDHLPTLLLRAALRLDHGEHAAAAADFDRLAAQAEPGSYLRMVAERYRGADDSRRGVQAVQLGGLPEPVTPEEKFVAAFHALRGREPAAIEQAEQWLREAMDVLLPARDLRLLALLGRAGNASGDEQLRLAQEVYDEALRLEGIHGKTARTLHAQAAACLRLGRFADALAPLQEALALRPNRHGPLQNLGWAYYKLGDLEAANEHLGRALEVWPQAPNTICAVALVRAELGDFDAALALLDQIAPESGATWAWQREYQKGSLEVKRAIALDANGDTEAARSAASRALPHYRQARQLGAPGARIRRMARFAEALANADLPAALRHFLRGPADLDNAALMRNLSSLITEESAAANAKALRAFLLRGVDGLVDKYGKRAGELRAARSGEEAGRRSGDPVGVVRER
ncbi:MAG: serine/threonine-protein kinase [Planctomycetota bacterium]